MPNGLLADRRVLVLADPVLAGELSMALVAEGGRVSMLTDPALFVSATSVRSAIDAAAEALGGLDLVVHGHVRPGAFERVPIVELSEERWADTAEGSLSAGLWVAQAAAPHLRERRGRLVFLVSTVGMAGAAGFGPLAVAHEGLRHLAKSAAKQWGAQGVTVNCLALGPQHWLEPRVGDAVAAGISLAPPALGSAGALTADIGPVVAFLGSDPAHFVTGATLTCDGGVWMAL